VSGRVVADLRGLGTDPLSFQLRRKVNQTGYLNNVLKE